MLNVLHKILNGRGGDIDTRSGTRTVPIKDVADEEIPRYPPFAKGLPVAPIDKILATQAELIERIRNSLGFTIDDYNHLVLPVIQRYAAFVHLLPASEAHHHRGAGGLFRHGLEVAFGAAQTSESVIFSIEGTPRERRENEPRWRLASCFSGLLHDVGKPLSDVSIADKDGSIVWNPYFESLHDWATRHSIDRYFIRWRDRRHKRHEQFSLLAVDRIIPPEIREYLAVSGPPIIEAMLEAISGASVNQPVTKLILRADQESVSRDLRQSRLDVDEFAYGVPVERYVFDAIRRLIKTGKWKVNEAGAKVWNLHQGVFIAWKPLGDLYELISQDRIPGIPRDPDTLADILIERGFAIPNTVLDRGEKAYYRYWEVLPEILQNGVGPVKILMLRLESDELIFTNEPSAAVAAVVVGDVEKDQVARFGRPNPESLEAKSKLAGKPATKGGDAGKNAATEQLAPQEDMSSRDVARSAPPHANDGSIQHDVADRLETEPFPEEPTPQPKGDTRKALESTIAEYGEAAPILERAIMPVLEGRRTLGEVLCLMQRQAVILYPEGARSLGAPSEVLRKLSQANAIIPDPIMPGRKIRDFSGIKAIVLSERLSDAAMAAIKEAEGAMGAAALQNAPGQQKTAQPDINRTEKRVEQEPRKPKSGSKVQRETMVQSAEEKPEVPPELDVAVQTEPVEGKQNVARLPTREKFAAAPIEMPKPALEIGPIDFDQKEGPGQEPFRKFEPFKGKTKPQDIKEEDFLPTGITPAKAIKMLKEMIQKGSGRWLVSPVIEEDGCLVTSDKAFEMIAGENVGISKHILRGMLKRGQRRPLLQIRQGKLYLQVDET